MAHKDTETLSDSRKTGKYRLPSFCQYITFYYLPHLDLVEDSMSKQVLSRMVQGIEHFFPISLAMYRMLEINPEVWIQFKFQ